MDLLRRSLKNDNFLTKKNIKSELGLIFSNVLKEDNKNNKRKLNLLKLNLLKNLDKKPTIRFKTKKIFEEFENFLNRFEK